MGRTTGLWRMRAAAGAVALAAIAVACSGDDASSAGTNAIADSNNSTDGTDIGAPTSVPGPAVDETLTVGVVLPLTGPGSEIGTVMNDAIELARREIAGSEVEVRKVEVVVVDEATLDGDITPPLQEIFTADVDAVIGPASSLLAARLLPIALGSGVLTCSPTANALSLDDFPDADSLFVRTIASDSLQAEALARQLDGTGANITLAYVDDAYGRPFMELVRNELRELESSVVLAVGFDPLEPDYQAIAAKIVAARTATIGIIGDPDAGPRLVQSLADVIDPEVLTSVWVNDAMRVPATANSYRRLAGSAILRLMSGVSPRSTVAASATSGSSSTALPDDGRFFAANAYDCMNVIALAADQSAIITGANLADQVIQVTNGGTPCASFPSCVRQLREDRSIDYDGPTAVLDIGRDGDPIVGVFDVYHFDDDGLDVTDDGEPIRVTPDD